MGVSYSPMSRQHNATGDRIVLPRTFIVPRALYIASQKPEECLKILFDNGITVPDRNDTRQIAQHLRYKASQDDEFAKKVMAIHPDKELLCKLFREDKEKNHTEKEKRADGEEVKNPNASKPWKKVNTAYVLLGVGSALLITSLVIGMVNKKN